MKCNAGNSSATGVPRESGAAAADYDVAIVGMGPAGLALASLLGQWGLRTLLLERELKTYGLPRAVAVDDEAMRVYQALGLDEKMAADMVMDVAANLVLPNGRRLAQLRPSERRFWKSPMCFFYQPVLEEVLMRNLARFPEVDVRIGHELVGLSQDTAGVTIDYRVAVPGANELTFAAERKQVRVRYLVACDGGRSKVRELCGIGMTGQKYPEPWLVVDVKLDAVPRHLPYFTYFCDPARPHLSCPQPDGHHRFEFMLLPGETREQMERPEVVRQLICRFVDPGKATIVRSLVYTFNALVADRWQDGRVLLAGDAAHMTPQFFGQGMNSGARDVGNLAWKLALVLRNGASPTLLASYQEERLAHYKGMMRVSVALGRFVSVRNPALAALRNGLAWLLCHTPWLGRYIQDLRFKPAPRFPRGSYVGLPRHPGGAAGVMMIQPMVRTLGGRHLRLDDLLGSGFALVGCGADPRDHLSPAERRFWDQLGTRYLCVYPMFSRPWEQDTPRAAPPGLVEVEDVSGRLLGWFRRHGGFRALGRNTVAVIRPDRYVFGLCRPERLGAVTGEAAQQFGIALAEASLADRRATTEALGGAGA